MPMTDRRLTQLAKYLRSVDHSTSHADFWAGWDRVAGSLAAEVWSDDATPELREAYTDLLATADDAGWAVPDEQCQP